MTNKEEDEIIDKLLQRCLEKQLPERTVELRAFCEGKQVTLETIYYKAGGWDIRKRLINKDFCEHEQHKNCKCLRTQGHATYMCKRCGMYHSHNLENDKAN